MMTVREVADLLQISPLTVYRLAKTKGLPAFRVGKNWRFSSEAVEKWMKEGSVLEKS
jgi:excisionase family DNA binding protein